ncbi:hypothetical protein [Scytonema sp. PRP1]
MCQFFYSPLRSYNPHGSLDTGGNPNALPPVLHSIEKGDRGASSEHGLIA